MRSCLDCLRWLLWLSAAVFKRKESELKVRDLDDTTLYREFDSLGKRITEGFEKIETTKESIWAIHSKWRGWFYGILSIFGVVVSSFMVYMEWDKSWFKVFGVLWNSILGSVIIVWFGFQLLESIMGAYTIASEWVKKSRQEREAHLKAIEDKGRQEGFREGSQKEHERTLKMIEITRQKVGEKASAAEAFQAMESACSSSRDR